MDQGLMTIQALAEAMANRESDPEKLIIQYAVPTPEKPVETCISKDTLESILIPRTRTRGDALLTLTPSDTANSIYKYHIRPETYLQGQHSAGAERMTLYESLHIPGVEDELIRNFGELVEITHGNKPASDSLNQYIQATLVALSEHAKDIRYEAWNSEKDLESYSLAEGLGKFSQAFPPKFPSSENSGARVKAYKLTLTRLLVLLLARSSDPSIDLRIWELAGQILALAGAPNPRTEFAVKIGSFVIKGVLNFLMEEARGSGGGGSEGGGSEEGGSPSATSVGAVRRGWGGVVGYTVGFATLAVIALSPAVVIAPIAGLIGFEATGVVAGSLAAAWQASIGNVAAGSLFAMLQGIGAAGAASAAGAPLLATVSGVAAYGARRLGKAAISNMGSGPGVAFEFVITIILLG